ncbi:sushi, nidogen and EGF-like domain-containing protein 1 [Dysidea avara]|uniref:sushi, nidogen and EGF-like domain-containing protein 1 n=1 Tax=Dysidea avara TaxID=196820 RepID=UPI0033301A4F
MANKTVLIVLLYLLRVTLCVPLSEFFPFGEGIEEPNQRLANGDSSFECIFSKETYNFCNTVFFDFCFNCYQLQAHITATYVCNCMGIIADNITTDGGLSFGGKPIPYTTQTFPLGGDNYLAAPFWINIDTTTSGNVWFRESTIPELLSKANDIISTAFPLQSSFSATQLFIATWDHVGANGGMASQHF